jgi:hypothetical protein
LILGATLAAVVISVTSYYGHFSDSYASLLRARRSAVAAPSSSGVQTETEAPPTAPRQLKSLAGWPRIENAARLAVVSIGWPLVALALVGGWRLIAEKRRDRVVWALVAWTAAGCAFWILGAVAPDSGGNQRYADEFIGRAVHVASPAAVVSAAYGVAWAWQSGLGMRAAACAAALVTLVQAARHWASWF